MERVAGIISKSPWLLKAVALCDKEMTVNGWQRHSRMGYLDFVQRFLAIRQDEEVISFLAYERYQLPRNISIIGAWTHPDYRRRGLYQSLFDELVAIYRKERFNTIMSGYHKTNLPSKTMQEKRGSKIQRQNSNELSVGTIFYLREEEYA